MFVILLDYIKSLDVVGMHLAAHRAFLDEGYAKHYFLCSGPREPRTGGVIIALLSDRKQLDGILREDPFMIHNIATYQVIKFDPVKKQAYLNPLLS